MLLAIGIGNTTVGIGAFDGERLLRSWQLAADRQRTVDEVGLLVVSCLRHAGLDPARIAAVALGSVVPALERLYTEASAQYLGRRAWVVTHDADLGIANRTLAPEQVGIDRLLVAAAAYARYGGPLVVVDFGTATTVNAISAHGAFLGGAIAPGLATAHDALVARAAKLPPVPLAVPDRAIGRTTREAMQAGLILGYVGLVEGLIRRVQDELGAAPVVATGGLAATMARATALIQHVEPHLMLHGIRLAHERRRAGVGAAGG